MATYSYPNDFVNTSWAVYDGDIYVSSIGDATNGTGAPSNPFENIFKALEAVNADPTKSKIVIGTGEYRGGTTAFGLDNVKIVSDGMVIFKSYGTPYVFTQMGNGWVLQDLNFVDYNNAFNYSNLNGNTIIRECRFTDCSTLQIGGVLENCIIASVDLGTTLLSTENVAIRNCTFINCTIGENGNLANNNFTEIIDCHFDAASRLFFDYTICLSFDYNNQQPGFIVNVNETDYSSAADLFNASAPWTVHYQQHGMSEAPLFNNPAIGDYTLQFESPLLATGSWGQHIGAKGFALSFGNPETDTGVLHDSSWNDIVSEDNKLRIKINSSHGTIVTPEIDLGSRRILNKTNLFAQQHFESPPNNAVVDLINANTQPNIITFRMRWSDTVGGTAGAAYKEMVWNRQPSVDNQNRGNGNTGFDHLSEVAIKARYVQFEITLRDDTYFILQENADSILQEDGSKITLNLTT